MYEKTIKIDNQTFDIINDYSIEMEITKKEVLSRMANYCFYNSIDFSKSKKTISLNNKLSELENKLILRINDIPSLIKKIIDPDDYFFPIEDDYIILIEYMKSYIESKKLQDDFSSFLDDKQKEKYIKSLDNIENFKNSNL